MPRLSHARLSYVHFLTSLLNRRLSHHFAWERFKNPRLKSRHRNRRKRINYDKEIGIDIISIPSFSPFVLIFIYFDRGKKEKKKERWNFIVKMIILHRETDGRSRRFIDVVIFSWDLLVQRILHRGWSNENKDPSLQRCVAYYTYTRISRLPDCRGLVGRRGGFVMGDGVGAGTPLLACVYAFTCYVANDLCIPLITSMHCTVLSGDHSFIRPTCALRYCQRQKHRRRTIRAGCVKCATFTDCAID